MGGKVGDELALGSGLKGRMGKSRRRTSQDNLAKGKKKSSQQQRNALVKGEKARFPAPDQRRKARSVHLTKEAYQKNPQKPQKRRKEVAPDGKGKKKRNSTKDRGNEPVRHHCRRACQKKKPERKKEENPLCQLNRARGGGTDPKSPCKEKKKPGSSEKPKGRFKGGGGKRSRPGKKEHSDSADVSRHRVQQKRRSGTAAQETSQKEERTRSKAEKSRRTWGEEKRPGSPIRKFPQEVVKGKL